MPAIYQALDDHFRNGVTKPAQNREHRPNDSFIIPIIHLPKLNFPPATKLKSRSFVKERPSTNCWVDRRLLLSITRFGVLVKREAGPPEARMDLSSSQAHLLPRVYTLVECEEHFLEREQDQRFSLKVCLTDVSARHVFSQLRSFH